MQQPVVRRFGSYATRSTGSASSRTGRDTGVRHHSLPVAGDLQTQRPRHRLHPRCAFQRDDLNPRQVQYPVTRQALSRLLSPSQATTRERSRLISERNSATAPIGRTKELLPVQRAGVNGSAPLHVAVISVVSELHRILGHAEDLVD